MNSDITNPFGPREFTPLGEVALLSVDAACARFTIGDTPLCISAHFADTFRLQLGASTLPDYALLALPNVQSSLRVSETASGWTLALVDGDVVLDITRAPFRIAMRRGDTTLVTSITDQHFRGRSRVPAFGRGNRNGNSSGRWCLALALNADTAMYGFGEKFGPLDKRGQLVRGRIEDALGVNTELSYKNIPFCWSTDGWGMLLHTPGVVRHGVGYPQWSHRTYIADVEDEALDLFLFAGEPAHILDRYTQLTGRAAQPPLWGYGMWLSRAYYKTPQEAIDTAADVRRRGVPCDVITLDGRAAWEVRTRFSFEWDKSRFDDPQRILAELKAHDLKVCVWEYPYISVHNPLFAELDAKGWLLKNKDGKAYVFDWVKDPTDDPFGKVLTPLPPSGVLDFTHAEAAQWWADSHNKLFDDGVDVIKTDFGEQVEDDMIASNGDSGRRLHNVYPLLYNRAVFNATQRYNDAHGRGAAMVWGRDGFIGSQCVPMQWGGDPQSDWEAMAASIRSALGYGMSGVPYYATDVGGFYGAEQPSAELFLRWTANAVFSSHFRFHGIGEREPWAFGDAAEATAKKLLALRYQLIPYIAGTAAQATKTGLPLMRAMPLAFPHDRLARSFETQYLFGEALLVAPIIAAGGATQVYLPAGEYWFDFKSGERFAGGQLLQVQRDIDEAAIFGREGHVLCLGKAVMHTGEINLQQPIEMAHVFGVPRTAPCVMNAVVGAKIEHGAATLTGLSLSQCHVYGDIVITPCDNGVVVKASK